MPRGILELGRGLHQVYAQNGDHDHGARLEGKLDGEREEERTAEPSIPRHRTHLRHDAIDEAHGGPGSLDTGEEPRGGTKPVDLAAAVGATYQVRLDPRALASIERLVQQRGEKLPRLVAGHGRKRSSLSLRSIRARWSRERTVPSSRESTVAISS